VPAPAVPQPRRRALAEVEAHLAQAEEVRARYARDVAARGRAAGKDARRALVLLRLAEERLDQLRRSRAVLLAGEEG
jgi:hypothetical protein